MAFPVNCLDIIDYTVYTAPHHYLELKAKKTGEEEMLRAVCCMIIHDFFQELRPAVIASQWETM